jgi:hypothetical protein
MHPVTSLPILLLYQPFRHPCSTSPSTYSSQCKGEVPFHRTSHSSYCLHAVSSPWTHLPLLLLPLVSQWEGVHHFATRTTNPFSAVSLPRTHPHSSSPTPFHLPGPSSLSTHSLSHPMRGGGTVSSPRTHVPPHPLPSHADSLPKIPSMPFHRPGPTFPPTHSLSQPNARGRHRFVTQDLRSPPPTPSHTVSPPKTHSPPFYAVSSPKTYVPLHQLPLMLFHHPRSTSPPFIAVSLPRTYVPLHQLPLTLFQDPPHLPLLPFRCPGPTFPSTNSLSHRFTTQRPTSPPVIAISLPGPTFPSTKLLSCRFKTHLTSLHHLFVAQDPRSPPTSGGTISSPRTYVPLHQLPPTLFHHPRPTSPPFYAVSSPKTYVPLHKLPLLLFHHPRPTSPPFITVLLPRTYVPSTDSLSCCFKTHLTSLHRRFIAQDLRSPPPTPSHAVSLPKTHLTSLHCHFVTQDPCSPPTPSHIQMQGGGAISSPRTTFLSTNSLLHHFTTQDPPSLPSYAVSPPKTLHPLPPTLFHHPGPMSCPNMRDAISLPMNTLPWQTSKSIFFLSFGSFHVLYNVIYKFLHETKKGKALIKFFRAKTKSATQFPTPWKFHFSLLPTMFLTLLVMQYGIWDMGYGIWDMRYEIWDRLMGLMPNNMHFLILNSSQCSEYFLKFRW